MSAAIAPLIEQAKQPTGDPLDPVENFSRIYPGAFSETPTAFHKGMYREQYRAASRDGIWGHEGARCGTSVIEQYIYEVGLVVRPVLCDCWACKMCGPRKAAWLIREIAAAQEDYALDYFWTLTVWTKTCTAKESYSLIKKWWNRLRSNLVERFGPMSFIWTVESTKRGYAHLHLLTSLDIPPTMLASMWRTVTGGSWKVDAQPVESERAGTYLAKYCSQQARQRAEPGNEHLFGQQFFNHSRDVKLEPFRKEGEHDPVTNEGTGEIKMVSRWTRVDTPYWERLAHHKASGLHAAEEQIQGAPHAVLVERKGF